jgi:hypothetical protein
MRVFEHLIISLGYHFEYFCHCCQDVASGNVSKITESERHLPETAEETASESMQVAASQSEQLFIVVSFNRYGGQW